MPSSFIDLVTGAARRGSLQNAAKLNALASYDRLDSFDKLFVHLSAFFQGESVESYVATCADRALLTMCGDMALVRKGLAANSNVVMVTLTDGEQLSIRAFDTHIEVNGVKYDLTAEKLAQMLDAFVLSSPAVFDRIDPTVSAHARLSKVYGLTTAPVQTSSGELRGSKAFGFHMRSDNPSFQANVEAIHADLVTLGAYPDESAGPTAAPDDELSALLPRFANRVREFVKCNLALLVRGEVDGSNRENVHRALRIVGNNRQVIDQFTNADAELGKHISALMKRYGTTNLATISAGPVSTASLAELA